MGRLEALWEEAPGARAAAVVCHPHPLFGGTMHTHAVHRIARAARTAGTSTLRFQFRGVGRSAGLHDGGKGERDDVRAALGWVKERAGRLPLLAAGFSFGAWMALEAACPDPGVAGLFLAGLAHRDFEAGDPAACAKPIAAVQAERDEYLSPGEVGALLTSPAGPRRVVPVPGASHLFVEDLGSLERQAQAAFVWLLEGAA